MNIIDVLPHANTNGSGFCSGDYRTNLSLVGDIVYFMKWIRDYNKHSEYYSPPSKADLSPSHNIHSKLIPTFYMDITKGSPVVKDVELVGNVEDYITIPKLEDTRVFYWKGKAYPKIAKGQLGKINLNQYFNYAKFIERYNIHTSVIPDTNVVSEVA